jgi:hypothetical protein
MDACILHSATKTWADQDSLWIDWVASAKVAHRGLLLIRNPCVMEQDPWLNPLGSFPQPRQWITMS